MNPTLAPPRITKVTNTSSKAETVALNAHENVRALIEAGFIVSTPLSAIISSNSVITYVCKCNNEFTRTLKDVMRRANACRDCLNNKQHSVPDASMTHILEAAVHNSGGLEEGEKFKAIKGGWFSNKGRLFNCVGKRMTLDEKGRYHLVGTTEYLECMLKEHFNLIAPSRYAERRDEQEKKFQAEVTAVVTKPAPLAERVQALKEQLQTETQKFEQKLRDPNLRFVILPSLPSLQIFSDGSIFNLSISRFVGTTETYEGPNKKGYLQFHGSGVSGLRVHRVVCMAFHPIEGKRVLEDYKGLQVNHKDGDVQNNAASNLEWVTPSENMQHAYDNGHNRKCRPVLQYKLNDDGTAGELIAEHISVAAAARATNRAEHQVREPCRGKGKQQEFFFKFKFEEENDAWAKKYSSSAIVAKEQVVEKVDRLTIRVYHKLPNEQRGEFIKTYHSYKDIETDLGVSEQVVRRSTYGFPNRQKYIFERVKNLEDRDEERDE